jgi:protein involved in ribonucleotide reduction
MARIVYFSNVSENTHRFVQKLGVEAMRIPLRATDPAIVPTEPYLLIVPTYGGSGGLDKRAVPAQVVAFLNDPWNNSLLRGVVAAGNRNFGSEYCLAGRRISARFNVPVLHRFEILGEVDDVATVITRLETL